MIDRKLKVREAARRHRARRRGDIVPILKTGPVPGTRYSAIKHGTSAEYNRYGCRCSVCRQAETKRKLLWSRSHPEKNREYVKRNQQVNLAIMREAKNKPCVDCKIQYPYYVMQFDHLKDKQYGLGSGEARNIGKDRLLAEIAKCEVVCANCHMERSHMRRQVSIVV